MDSDTKAELLKQYKWRVAPDSLFGDGLDQDRLVLYLPEVATLDLFALVSQLTGTANFENPTFGTPPQVWTGTWVPGRVWLDQVKPPLAATPTMALWMELWKGTKTVGDLSSSVVMEDGRFVNVKTAWYFNQATVAALPSNTAGVLYRRGPVMTDPQRGTYTYTVDKLTAVKNQWSGTYTTVRGTVAWAKGRNCTEAEVDAARTATFDGTKNNSGEPDKNAYGLFDYDFVSRPAGTPSAAPGDWYAWTGSYWRQDEPYIEPAEIWNVSAKRYIRQYRIVTATVDYNIRHSYEDALKDIANGLNGSSTSSHGQNRYVSRKVISIAYGLWGSDETNHTEYASGNEPA
jgi:hypothetical protein